MPIALRRVGPSRVYTALTLVNKVLRGCRQVPTATIEQAENAEPMRPEVVETVDALNHSYQDLMEIAGSRFAHADGDADMEPGVIWYDTPAGFLNIVGDPFIEGIGQLGFETVDFLEQATAGLEVRGTPSRYTVWNEKVGILPAPSEEFLRGRYVFASGEWYVCTKSTQYQEPRTAPSGDGDAYWAKTAVVPGAEADFAWDAARVHLPGRFTVRFRMGLTILAANSDVPVLPARFYPAMIAGAKFYLSPFLKEDRGLRDDRRNIYTQAVALLKLNQTPSKSAAMPYDPRPI